MNIPKIDYKPDEPLSILFERNKEIVFDRFLDCIKDGLQNNAEDVTVFELGDTGYFLETNIIDWCESLDCCITYFSMIEDYEKCIECQDVQKKINKKITNKKT
jgi:hypothetical protein